MFLVTVPGRVSVGGVVSWTVTVKLPELVLPAASETEQETDVVPSGKLEPEAGEQLGVSEVPPSEAVAV